ncbi:MAG: 50S ribosomal protein L23 [archaeon]
MKNPYSILKYPLSTEKSVKLMQTENKIIFIVERRTTKPEIKKAMEELFKVKVLKVTTQIMPTGKKKAYIKLAPETPAVDIATQLGLI